MDLKLDYALAKVKSENFNESPEALEIKISKMYSEFAKNMAQHITEAIANVRNSIARKERAVNGPAMEAVNRNFDEAIEDYKKQKAESAKLLENSIKG
jgi:prefoldin subunit 5